MIKSFYFVVFLLLFSLASSAQYYYKDIITNQQVYNDMQAYKANRVNTIKLASFEDDGSPSQGFFCERRISKDYRKTELRTRSAISGSSQFTSFFNDRMKIVKTIDSSALSSTTNVFEYDDKDRIIKITSVVRSNDDDFVTELLEEHTYSYNAAGIPEKLTVVRNKKDTTVILFSADEHNNIAIEKNTTTGAKYYYYWDDKNRLTDVVHMTENTDRMWPDYKFEYNNAGLLTQMITREEGSSYYYTWRYTYSGNLRSKEKCYSKERRLLGTIEYEYK